MRQVLLNCLIVAMAACGGIPDTGGLYPVIEDNALQIAIDRAGVSFERVLFVDIYPEDINWDGIYERNWVVVEDLGVGFQATWINAETGEIIEQIETTLELTARATRTKLARESMIPTDPEHYPDECGE